MTKTRRRATILPFPADVPLNKFYPRNIVEEYWKIQSILQYFVVHEWDVEKFNCMRSSRGYTEADYKLKLGKQHIRNARWLQLKPTQGVSMELCKAMERCAPNRARQFIQHNMRNILSATMAHAYGLQWFGFYDNCLANLRNGCVGNGKNDLLRKRYLWHKRQGKNHLQAKTAAMAKDKEAVT